MSEERYQRTMQVFFIFAYLGLKTLMRETTFFEVWQNRFYFVVVIGNLG